MPTRCGASARHFAHFVYTVNASGFTTPQQGQARVYVWKKRVGDETRARRGVLFV